MTIEAVEYLKSIKSVRDTTSQVFNFAVSNGGGHYFDLDLGQMPRVADFLCEIVKRDYGTEYASIPPHGRWQHLNHGHPGRVEGLIAQWRDSGVDEVEVARKLVDLLVFSVLVDAGAGNSWKFTVPGSSTSVGRSEGLAVASYYLFVEGSLSDDRDDPYKVTGRALSNFDAELFSRGFQVSEANPLAGAPGRVSLIQRLGAALLARPDIFGAEARPGALVDYLYAKSTVTSDAAGATSPTIDLQDVWDALMQGLTSIWPAGRTVVNGEPLGDAWRLDTKAAASSDHTPAGVPSDIVTFHKLTQWLCYSLLVPLERYGYKFRISNKSLQTGLPEYRNGGLFYDFGVLKLKSDALKGGLAFSAQLRDAGHDASDTIPTFEPHQGAIVEWRCLTVGLLDSLLPLVNKKLEYELGLPQLIEAGSWKAGREIAAKLRPATGGPPIELYSDGTVF
ncbi:URC4/urg3 family protein [Lachancea thermotolerans CBS 6340]|uniref:KLTH0D07392p n=1 Tax=Lachancea thermotolerans (strain ATCC 56472 / CBS 6340 / NRRL Y-8284) TaxID=559295 RepID=C5DGR1_LACTC|nr:KLTH0D07392p [Lachancea thermotolerans CBS 6340]CAR22603.1 KLTH0D07392p [Lachancea thermotolerans CBS 6340]